MKRIFVFLVVIFLNGYTYSQTIDQVSLEGGYIIDRDYQINLTICEHNQWFFTSCMIPEISDTNGFYTLCESFESSSWGAYTIADSVLYLKDRSDSLFLSLKVIDTLNLLVIYASKTLQKGEYLNKAIGFFSGYECGTYFQNIMNIKWHISGGELCRFKAPGNVFISDNYEIEFLPEGEGYWRKNEE